MLRYGQIVKIKTPQELHVMERFKSLIKDLSPHYHFRIENIPEVENEYSYSRYKPLRERGGFKDYIFEIAPGTLGILSFSLICYSKEEYSVFIKNPEKECTGANLKLVLGANDLTTDLTPEEIEDIQKTQAKFLIKRSRGIDNLSLVEKISDLQGNI